MVIMLFVGPLKGASRDGMIRVAAGLNALSAFGRVAFLVGTEWSRGNSARWHVNYEKKGSPDARVRVSPRLPRPLCRGREDPGFEFTTKSCANY